MARETTRVARGQRGVDANGDPQLGYDEALVGTGNDGAHSIEIDPSERAGNPFIADNEDDDTWDLPKEQGGKQTGGEDQGGGATRQTREPEQRQEEDDGEDLRLVYDEPEEDQRRGRRSRRNGSRRRAIDQRDQHIAYLTNELQQLKNAQAGLAGGQFDLSARDIEQRIGFHQSAIDRADIEIAKAIKESDGDSVVALQKERDRINYQLWQLQQAREGMIQHAERMARGGQAEGPQLTPQQIQYLQAQDSEFQRMKDVFLDRYSWFDEANDDPDHQFVKQLDQTLYREGFQRHQKAFWHEMERRMKSAGFRPDSGAEFDDDEQDGGFQSRREFQSRRFNGNGNGHYNGGPARRANLPPTGMVRSSQRPGRGEGNLALSDEQVDLLRQEGLLENNLSDADQAKKTRIITKWTRGAQALARSRG